MKFVFLHKMNEELETGAPDMSVIESVDKLSRECGSAFLGREDLKPRSQRTCLTYAGRQRAVTEGEFGFESTAGFVLMRVRSKDDALALCDKLVEANGDDLRIHLGPVVEPWDLGLTPTPEDPPLRFLALPQRAIDVTQVLYVSGACETIERGRFNGAACANVIARMEKAGVVQASGIFDDTTARVRFDRRANEPRPQELIAGYAVIDMASMEVAKDWAKRFGKAIKAKEVQLRQLIE